MAETRSFINSIEGMHYASDEFAGADIEAFVKQVRQRSPHLQYIGMFQDVSGEMREYYNQYMVEKGFDSFSIHGYTDSGAQVLSDKQGRYLPIHSVAPLDEDLHSILGIDFSSSPQIELMLDKVIETGESFITRSPIGWPLRTEYLLIQPIYFGSEIPHSVEDRRELFAGGIWASINLADMMYHEQDWEYNRKLPHQSNLELILKFGSTVTNIKINKAPATDQQGVNVGFSTLSQTKSWKFGSNELNLSMMAKPRMAVSSLIETIFVLIGLLIVITTIILNIYRKRCTELERFENLRTLNSEREKAELTLAQISDAVISLDSNHHVIYMNPSANRFLKINASAELNHSIDNYLLLDMKADHSNPFPGFENALEKLPAQTQAEYDVTLSLPHLKDAIVKLTLTSMYDDRNIIQGSIVVMKDVSKERQLTAELEFRANHDSLTGTPNRYYFEKRLQSLIDNMEHSNKEHALCYIDLDQFKVVNDTCGHAAGDRLLCNVTNELKSSLRDGDILARLGGDEFGIIICDCIESDGLVIANKIHDFFKNFIFEQDGTVFTVTASMGFVAISKEFNNFKTILSSVDIACYTAKDSGRNALVVYSGEDDTVLEREQELNWLPKLQNALESNGFRLLVQAIGDVGKQGIAPRVAHYEFLLRMLSPTGEEILPFKFIQAAERYDLMIKIDHWVIENAIKNAGEMLTQLNHHCTFSINLSGQSMSDPKLLDIIKEQLDNYNVDASNLWFEITETAAISHFATAVQLIKGIRDMGCKVALDDFGSGLSSFGYLQKLPVDILKIDGQFVKDMATNPFSYAMVQAIYQVSNVMGLATVAEFVEDAATVEALSEIGVDFAQGYYIARPCSLEDALAAQLLSAAA